MFRTKFLQKSQWEYMSNSPGVELGGSKDCRVWNIIMYWNEKVDPLKGSTLQKLPVITKNASNKLFRIISYKNVTGCISLSLPGVDLEGFKDCHFWNIIVYWNCKVDSL